MTLAHELDTTIRQLCKIGLAFLSGTPVEHLVASHGEVNVTEAMNKFDVLRVPMLALTTHVDQVAARHANHILAVRALWGLVLSNVLEPCLQPCWYRGISGRDGR